MIWKFPNYEVNKPINWEKLATQFDWLRDMQGVPQDVIWHEEGDVWAHTQMVVNELVQLDEFLKLDEQNQHILFAAALLHDVEKRSTTTTEILDGIERIISPRHAQKGEYTARKTLYKEIPTPFLVREQIANLVRLHGLPIWAIEKDDPRKSVIEASLSVNTAHLALLAKADVLGRICKDQEELLFKVELFKELCIEHQCLGHDRNFASPYGRYLYLNKAECAPNYEPYNDLEFEVTVLSALPGSGKDTYIQKHLDLPILSLDSIRRQHRIEPTDKKRNGLVVQLAKEQAKSYLRSKTSFVLNATNITRDMRSKWISLFVDYGARIKIIYLEVPYKQLLSQNRNRDYKVPEQVIDKLISRLEIPTFREAHEVEYLAY